MQSQNIIYRNIIWLLASLTYALAIYVFSHTSDPVNEFYLFFLGVGLLYVGNFLLYFIGRRFHPDPRVVCAVFPFFVFLFWNLVSPLSTDFNRILFEGEKLLSGGNPYCYSPSSYDVSAKNYTVNHPKLTAIYPPLPLILGGIFDGYNEFRCLLFFVSILFCFSFYRLFIHQRNAGYEFILILFNPLLIFESFWSLHLELIQVTAICLSAQLLISKRDTLAYVLLYIAIMVKLIPVLLLGLFIKKSLNGVMIGLLIIAMSILTFLVFSKFECNPFTSLRSYSLNWHFNSLSWHLFDLAHTPISTRRIFAAVAMALFVAFSFFSKDSEFILKDSFFRNIALILMGYFLLSPTAHPWYFICPLVFSLGLGARLFIFCIGLSFSLFFSYQALYELSTLGLWNDRADRVALVYLFPYFLLLFSYFFNIDYFRGKSKNI